MTAEAAKPVKQPKSLPAPNSDFYEVYETLAPEELATVKRVRAFMEAKVAPVITKYWVDDAFPFDLLPAVRELPSVVPACKVMVAPAARSQEPGQRGIEPLPRCG
jgi:hypothetical protein